MRSFPARLHSQVEIRVQGWFSDGQLNICANALDRHVAAGDGDRLAIIWDSAMVSP
jgi:hypothetical protein